MVKTRATSNLFSDVPDYSDEEEPPQIERFLSRVSNKPTKTLSLINTEFLRKIDQVLDSSPLNADSNIYEECSAYEEINLDHEEMPIQEFFDKKIEEESEDAQTFKMSSRKTSTMAVESKKIDQESQFTLVVLHNLIQGKQIVDL
jgi:hypothetical protein